jgi:hypothetical protein
MAAVLTDYHIAYQLAQNLPPERHYEAPLYLRGVLAKHHCSQANFDASMIWYTRNPTELGLVYTRVNRDLAGRAADLAEAAGAGSSPANAPYKRRVPKPFLQGDTANVWQPAPFARLTALHGNRQMQNVLTPDSTFRATDRLEWQLDARLQGKGQAVLLLMAAYAPDSVVVDARLIEASGRYTLHVQNDSATTLKQVWSMVQYYPISPSDSRRQKVSADTAPPAPTLLMDGIKLMRYHRP